MSKCDLPESTISQAFSKAHFKAQTKAALAEESDDSTVEAGDLVISLANAISSAVTTSCPEAIRYLHGKEDHSSTESYVRMPTWMLYNWLFPISEDGTVILDAEGIQDHRAEHNDAFP